MYIRQHILNDESSSHSSQAPFKGGAYELCRGLLTVFLSLQDSKSMELQASSSIRDR